MSSDSPWLSAEQQQVWRRWVSVNAELASAINRDLQTGSGLSIQDFEVLVRLTESTHGRARVTDLAGAMQWERSRLSHHVTRMVSRGLVTRRECPADGRGAFVEITAAGREAIEKAAPGHARLVKDVVFGRLTAQELATLGTVTQKMLDRLGEPDPLAGTAGST